ncbi:uncharacterized protein LOC129947928 isoform X2 [Eupeodes corollae]|nr:uncharacterized protein LOC129947928 isoform X2 [Eupeodes corollae]
MIASSPIDPRMVIHQQSPGQQRPIVDLLVALIAVPILIMCALQLEKHMQGRWEESSETRWLVFALGVSMLLISVLICGYVTHRMGVCMWTGPLEDSSSGFSTNNTDNNNIQHINSQNDILRIVDSLPPSYESVVKCDIPPPAYDCVIVNMEQCKEEEANRKTTTTTATSPPQGVGSLHM